MTLYGNWTFPTAIRFGAGRIAELGEACREAAMARPLLVTDPALAALPPVAAAQRAIKQAGLELGVFSDIKGNPTSSNVEAALEAYRAGGHDGIVALGGGSALDAGKAVALMAGQSRPIWDFENVADNWRRADAGAIAPVVAVPTTAGTGSEVGRASVINNEADRVKKVIFHPAMMPAIVICDPELTVGLPPHLTAATGMDALAHNLEAFCAPGYHPLARGIAVEGMRLIKDFLARAVADGSDIDARAQMMAASSMGATAFQRGLGAIHAIAHGPGALYDAHHGLMNAIIMPYVLAANRPAIEDEIAWLANALGIDEGFDGLLDWILALRAEIAIPHTLAEAGLDDSEADKIGAMAVIDPCAATNPVSYTAEQYAALYRDAVHGRL